MATVSSDTGRRLVCLHGAGVAGVPTWGPMLPDIDRFDQIWVPDLYGAGDTHHVTGERPFSIPELVKHLTLCLADLQWQQFDLVGYSFGGVLAMELAAAGDFQITSSVLIEPALMEREDWCETQTRRRAYVKACEPLKHNSSPEQGVTEFLDLVSPNRSKHPRVERRVVSRLAKRPVGLAYALESVNQHAETLDRAALIQAQPDRVLSLVGGRTPPQAHRLHQQLAQQHAGWHYQIIEGCDHALPYQKPQAVARALNAFFAT